MIRKSSRLPGLIVLILLAMLGGALAEELQKVTLAMSSASIPGATARIADELGLFSKHGIEATIRAMDNGSMATSALVSGSVDFITDGASDMILAQARGQQVVALTTTYHGPAAVLVLSNSAAARAGVAPNASIHDRLKALNGITIASPSATSPFTVSIRSSAETAGAKINLTYMTQPSMVAALQTGAIDGFMASAPFYVAPPRGGFGVIWINGPKGEFPVAPANSTLLLTMRDVAAAHPELVDRLIAVFLDFGREVAAHPAAVKAAIARLNPTVDPATVDMVFDTEASGFAVGKLTVGEIDHDITFMKGSGISAPGLDTLRAVDMMFP